MSTDISELREINGFIGACLVDAESGLMLASESSDAKFDLEAAGAANTEVMRAKTEALNTLGLADTVEDILISLSSQYHLIRPLESNPMVFIYLAVDRKTANLGMARMKAKSVEGKLKI